MKQGPHNIIYLHFILLEEHIGLEVVQGLVNDVVIIICNMMKRVGGKRLTPSSQTILCGDIEETLPNEIKGTSLEPQSD